MRRWAWMASRRSSTGRTWRRNLADLHERLRSKRYRHQPIRRVHIPKDKGKTRPIGISTIEDKMVQDAMREVLEAIYEQEFHGLLVRLPAGTQRARRAAGPRPCSATWAK